MLVELQGTIESRNGLALDGLEFATLKREVRTLCQILSRRGASLSDVLIPLRVTCFALAGRHSQARDGENAARRSAGQIEETACDHDPSQPGGRHKGVPHSRRREAQAGLPDAASASEPAAAAGAEHDVRQQARAFIIGRRAALSVPLDDYYPVRVCSPSCLNISRVRCGLFEMDVRPCSHAKRAALQGKERHGWLI